MGSKSDMPAMEKAAKELTERGILHEVRVMSAHRDPEMVAEYAKNARMRGIRVIIAGAGLSAALPGVVAAHTDLPVIGVPLTSVDVGRGRAGRAALDRPDAAGRARGLRRAWTTRATPRCSRRAYSTRDRPLHPARDRGHLDRRGALRRDARRGGRRRRGAGRPDREELDAIRAATFTVDAINEREKILDHDTAAFVDVLAASAGPAGRWIHYGLTSSDVVDTGLALQLQRAGALLVPAARTLAWELAEKAREHAGTLCVGRTHGVHAEPTSFGLKLAGYAIEAHRNAERLERAFGQITAAISGAVGTYATLGPDYEARVLRGSAWPRDGLDPGRPA